MSEKSPMLSFGAAERNLVLGFKQRFREFRLTNDASQGSTPDRIMKWNGNGYCRFLQARLHDPVAALLPGCGIRGVRESDKFPSLKEPESTQPAPQPE